MVRRAALLGAVLLAGCSTARIPWYVCRADLLPEKLVCIPAFPNERQPTAPPAENPGTRIDPQHAA